MLETLQRLIALQAFDSANDVARRRAADLPMVEQALDAKLAAATSVVDAAKARLAENTQTRRAHEKDVAAIDTRLSRFDDHKAAVKTNQEYTALLHEISGAKVDKDAVEEKILILLEEADAVVRDVKAAEATLAEVKKAATIERAALNAERHGLDAELARLKAERGAAIVGVDARALALYEQLLKGRRGVAIASIDGETCTACQMRMRPHVAQQIRRNDALIQCDSCQRLLYAPVPPPA
jgi:uncharacterized protein